MKHFAGRLGITQRVLPSYRAPFFEKLAAHCAGGLAVFAGQPRPGEAIHSASELQSAQWQRARNRHWLGGPLYICWQSGLREWLEEWQPEALIIEANPRYLSSRIAIEWMRARRRPLIGWGLGTGRGGGLVSQVTQPWRRRFLSQFDALIAYSREGMQSFEALGLAATKLYHAPNAVVDLPSPPPQERSNEVPQLLFVGRLQARKGLDRLIRASQALQTELAHELHIVGAGPEKTSLEAIAGGERQEIRFSGPLFGAELEAAFRLADLFVLPGTGGLAIQQAMSFALPVIAGEGDGTQRDLLDESNGWQLATHSQAELEHTLRQALTDGEDLKERGQASFEKAKQQFNLTRMTDVFVQVINEVSA